MLCILGDLHLVHAHVLIPVNGVGTSYDSPNDAVSAVMTFVLQGWSCSWISTEDLLIHLRARDGMGRKLLLPESSSCFLGLLSFLRRGGLGCMGYLGELASGLGRPLGRFAMHYDVCQRPDRVSTSRHEARRSPESRVQKASTLISFPLSSSSSNEPLLVSLLPVIAVDRWRRNEVQSVGSSRQAREDLALLPTIGASQP